MGGMGFHGSHYIIKLSEIKAYSSILGLLEMVNSDPAQKWGKRGYFSKVSS